MFFRHVMFVKSRDKLFRWPRTERWPAMTYINVLGLCSFVMKFPEDGTSVPKHVVV
jgi:hypothetical protein